MVCRFSTIETSASPEKIAGSIQPMVLINGFMAMRSEYLNTISAFAHTLGASHDDVRLLELVQQRAAHDADQPRGAGQTDHRHRDPDPFEQIDDAGQVPGRADELRRLDADGTDAEQQEEQPQHQQGEEEVGRAQADHPDEGPDVVEEAVLMGGPNRCRSARRSATPPEW